MGLEIFRDFLDRISMVADLDGCRPLCSSVISKDSFDRISMAADLYAVVLFSRTPLIGLINQYFT